jgi:hypothetical protein
MLSCEFMFYSTVRVTCNAAGSNAKSWMRYIENFHHQSCGGFTKSSSRAMKYL